MARQNTRAVKTSARTPLVVNPTPDTFTFEGAPAYTQDSLTELFTLATTHLAEGTFYEKAGDREDRYTRLIHTVTRDNPTWLAGMLPWLRQGANLRAASLAGAIEMGRALAAITCTPHPGGTCPNQARHFLADGTWTCDVHQAPHSVPVRPRSILASVLQRADEPGEALAYWTSRYGRALPAWLKRGVGDAAIRLWTENAALKWDSPARAWRMADVIELCHPGGTTGQDLRPFQTTTGDARDLGGLFPWLLADRHNRPDAKLPAESLPRLHAHAKLMAIPVEQRRAVLAEPFRLSAAGMTWESLAGWLQGPMDRQAWEAIIPSMGYMALLRNLRNFDEAGVSDAVAAGVAARLADPDQVATSRQLPFRFLSAYLAAPSDRWRHTLGVALGHAVRNVPVLHGRTLLCVDVSGSMSATLSDRSTVARWQVGALFAAVAAERSGLPAVDVVVFGTNSAVFEARAGASVLRNVERFGELYAGNHHYGSAIGHGTNTASAVRHHVKGHDRVIIFTDDQAHDGDPGKMIPPTTPLYVFDLGGYGHGSVAPGRDRHLVSGFDDSAWAMISRVELAAAGRWPWEV